jgi:hypothetical protein
MPAFFRKRKKPVAQHYEVPPGESLLIEGPANIIVKSGNYPQIGVKPPPEPEEPPPEPAPDPESRKK